MTIPRGFTRCDECEGSGIYFEDRPGHVDETLGCPHCLGSGLLPTEKLREEAAGALRQPPVELITADESWEYVMADAVLRKVAEHIKEDR